MFCAISTSEVYRPLSFMGTMVTCTSQLDVPHSTAPRLLQYCNNDLSQFTFHQDGAPLHSNLEARSSLSDVFPEWERQAEPSINWPPHSPDITTPDIHVEGYGKDLVYVTQLTLSIDQNNNKIGSAVMIADQDILRLCR